MFSKSGDTVLQIRYRKIVNSPLLAAEAKAPRTPNYPVGSGVRPLPQKRRVEKKECRGSRSRSVNANSKSCHTCTTAPAP